MVKLIFIRHGATFGNTLKRYIGSTDEPLLETQFDKQYPKADVIYTSPMLRCKQTAEIIYGTDCTEIADLRECDFGKFEGKNYMELDGDADYQAWIDSNGTLPFPDGEDHIDFKQRCVKAFETVMSNADNGTIAFIVHGGTIMAILERYSDKPSAFYDWHVGNGEGYEAVWENNKISVVNKI
jgi:Fructose-2,6-bisphosphatase